jgi:hypothetical protein
MRTHGIPLVAAMAAVALLSAAPSAANVTQDFGGYPAGAIVLHNGSGGNLWSDFTVSDVANNNGPNAVIIFDSSNPTGGDFDLGTPNSDFGGPGKGLGGRFGMPGENSIPRGNLIIIAESMIDANGDGRVDVPDDEGSGGCITFDFDHNVVPLSITLVDVDPYSARLDFAGSMLRVTADETFIGDNAVAKIDLPNSGFQQLQVCFTASGAIAELEYTTTTAVDEVTWGRVKSLYR